MRPANFYHIVTLVIRILFSNVPLYSRSRSPRTRDRRSATAPPIASPRRDWLRFSGISPWHGCDQIAIHKKGRVTLLLRIVEVPGYFTLLMLLIIKAREKKRDFIYYSEKKKKKRRLLLIRLEVFVESGYLWSGFRKTWKNGENESHTAIFFVWANALNSALIL